jgi:D-alanine transaminase
MHSSPRFAWLNGTLLEFSKAALPIEDRGLQFAESIYEVIPVTAGQGRLLGEHQERMLQGASALGIEAGIPPLPAWESMISELVAREAVTEGWVYAQVTGGTCPRAHLPSERPSPNFFLYLRAHRFPRAAEAERGIRVVTALDPRWSRCNLKTTMLLPSVLAKQDALLRGADEVLFLGPEGELREGGTTNVFVVEGRTLVTPPQDQHLLPGVTRRLVHRVAVEAHLEVRSEVLSLARARAADEVFVTATSRLVMPVVRIDQIPVREGAPGAWALDLARRLRAVLELSED